MNTTFKTLTSLAVGSVAAVAFASDAQAQTLLYTDSASFTDQVTNLTGTPALTVTTPTLADFNPADYIDLSVVVTFSGSLTSEGNFTNNSGQLQENFNVFTQVSPISSYRLEPGTGAPAPLMNLVVAPGGTVILAENVASLADGATVGFGPGGTGTIETDDTFTGSDFGLFFDIGDFSVDPFATVTTATDASGNFGFNIATSADATFTIEYFGTLAEPSEPTPEPAAVLGLGLFGLAGLATRRLKK